MVSLRFPFSFSQPPKLPRPNPNHANSSPFWSATTAAFVATSVAASAAAIAAVSQDSKHPFLRDALNSVLFSYHSHTPLWGSLSLADSSSQAVIESKTGVSFPSVLGNSRRLLGIGLRRKTVLGLKNIDVYAFGTTFLLQVSNSHLDFDLWYWKNMHCLLRSCIVYALFSKDYRERFSIAAW